VALLEDRALFFPRIAQLDDPFEGSFPAGQPLLNRLMDCLPPGQFLPELWSYVAGPRTSRRDNARLVDGQLLALAEYESAAMWRLYARQEPPLQFNRPSLVSVRLSVAPAVRRVRAAAPISISAQSSISTTNPTKYQLEFCSAVLSKTALIQARTRIARASCALSPFSRTKHMDHGREPPDSGVAFQ